MSTASDELRASFKAADDIRDAGLITPADIVRYDDIPYGDNATWNVLDVYRPKDAGDKLLPILVSVHGGGWVYGDKERYQYYCMNLAQRGFVVVNYTYRLAPEYKFPAPLEDTNQVFTWILENADKYHMDTGNLFAVGDSAGAHQLGIYAAICTNSEYAKEYDFAVPAGLKFKAIALNCGVYRVDLDNDKDSVTVSLMGDYLPEGGSDAEVKRICIENYITEQFPPVIYMTCTGDFLIDQAIVLEAKLMEKKIPHVFRFYGDSTRELGHVFHLNIRDDVAKLCNDEECGFFKSFL